MWSLPLDRKGEATNNAKRSEYCTGLVKPAASREKRIRKAKRGNFSQEEFIKKVA